MKRIIFLFMQGGPSQVDSFDEKPALEKHDGKQMPFDDARVIANTGKRQSSQRVMKSPWKFREYGQTGKRVSELFSATAEHADKLCFLHGMQTEGVAHGPATLFCIAGRRITHGRVSVVVVVRAGNGEPGFAGVRHDCSLGRERRSPKLQPCVPAGGVPGDADRKGGNTARTGRALKNVGNFDLSAEEQRRQLDLIRELTRASKNGIREMGRLTRSFGRMNWRGGCRRTCRTRWT
ncbi:MAG: DUF1501 domain-containing protein [Planctomycetales bacterium]